MTAGPQFEFLTVDDDRDRAVPGSRYRARRVSPLPLVAP